MFDSPLDWCAVVRKWVALDEKISECMRTQRCNVAVCPKSHLFAPAPSRAQDSPAGPRPHQTCEPGRGIRSQLRIF